MQITKELKLKIRKDQ